MGSSYIPPSSGGNGDMEKAVYDPQNVGKISGGTVYSATGGILSMVGGSGRAGNITTNGAGPAQGEGAGGSIDTSAAGAFAGGSIDTHGASVAGGSINTSDGGGSIDTTGVGSLQLGVAGRRTTLVGTGTANRALSLPDKNGDLATIADIAEAIAALLASPTTFASLLAAAGIAPAADSTVTPVTSATTNRGIITAIS